MTVNFAQKTLQAPLPEGEFRRARALFSFRTVLGIFQCSPKNCWMSEYLTLCLPSRRLVRNTRKGKYQRLYHTNNTSLNQINNMNLKKGKKPKRTPNTVLDIVLLGHFSCDRLEKAMAPHSSTLAWKIPWTEEPGGLQSMRSQRAGQTEQLNTDMQSITRLSGNTIIWGNLQRLHRGNDIRAAPRRVTGNF